MNSTQPRRSLKRHALGSASSSASISRKRTVLHSIKPLAWPCGFAEVSSTYYTCSIRLRPRSALAELVDHLRLYVDEKATIAKRLDGVVVAIHIRGGTPVRALIQLATEVGADYIVVGSHRGLHAGDWIRIYR